MVMHMPKLGTTAAVVVSLIAIQVYYGTVLAYSQRSRASNFSHSAMLAKIEISKFLVAVFISWYQWRTKKHKSFGILGYNSVPGITETDPGASLEEDVPMGFSLHLLHLFTPNDVSRICQLSLLYATLNLSNFKLIQHVDPGTIQLMKSGVTVVTALVSVVTMKANVNKYQWAAIALLTCGLLTTQLTPNNHDTDEETKYGFREYIGLVIGVLMTAVSGVYNEITVKSIDVTVHEFNLILYGSGSIIYVLLYLCTPNPHAEEVPGFFAGDGSLLSTLVFFGAMGLGVVMTMTFKYADAMIKCMATALSTGLLLTVSHILFGNPPTFAFLPGVFVVYYAIWAYLKQRSPLDPEKLSDSADKEIPVTSTGNLQSHFWDMMKLLASLTATIVFIICYNELMFVPRTPATHEIQAHSPLVSPFRNTLAFIRLHSSRPERLIRMEEYRSFFSEIHISMPRELEFPTTLTEDSAANDNNHHYSAVAETMSLILDNPEHSNITGLLYFHFDIWIAPLLFDNMNFSRIWVTDRDLNYECNKEEDEVSPWFGAPEKIHTNELTIQAFKKIQKSGYLPNSTEPVYCYSWVDFYYVPRKYFRDFATLAPYFLDLNIFHETAVPSILGIIDIKHRTNNYNTVIDRMGDCWGGPAGWGTTVHNLNWRRCGHKLNHDINELWLAHLLRLKEQKSMISESQHYQTKG
ncbi:hypothetical protein ABW20_dc0104306 [Dactylellina cionopaga]|nr:hypothetical protein ABW20_dc0104306 [Dactylellina cionopaga]